MKSFLIIVFVCVATNGRAAFEHLAHGSEAIALGGACVAQINSPWTAFYNPGGLPTVDTRSLSLHYSPQPFGLKELAHGSFSFVEPMSIGTLAASGSRFGFDLYREIDLQGSFGVGVNDLFSVGANVHYYHLSIANYGSASAWGVDVGILARISEEVRWGFSAFNVNAPTIGAAREELPQVFVTGIAYSPIVEATLLVDIEKDVRYPAELHAGVEYTILDILALRAGTISDPSVLCAGAGIHYSIIRLDYAFTNHSELGATHQVSLSIYLGDL